MSRGGGTRPAKVPARSAQSWGRLSCAYLGRIRGAPKLTGLRGSMAFKMMPKQGYIPSICSPKGIEHVAH
jgi:hypothetical protein